MTLRSGNKKERGGALKVILIIVGVLALLGVTAIIGVGWYAKTKVDEAGGMQAFGTKIMAKGIEALKPQLEKALPAEDLQRFNETLAQFEQQGGTLTPEQIQAVSKSVQTLGEKMQGGVLSEADAKAFVDEFSAILQPAAPAMQ